MEWNHKDMKEFVEQCECCLKSRGPRVNTKNKVIRANRPNELWECDLIGRIPDNQGNNKFIFTAIDHYTKWVETKVLKAKSSQEIVKAIQELL